MVPKLGEVVYFRICDGPVCHARVVGLAEETVDGDVHVYFRVDYAGPHYAEHKTHVETRHETQPNSIRHELWINEYEFVDDDLCTCYACGRPTPTALADSFPDSDEFAVCPDCAGMTRLEVANG